VTTRHGVAVWQVPLGARRREALLIAVCSVGIALSRLSLLHRKILEARYDPARGMTDRQIAQALALNVAEARAVHVGALLALAGELAKLEVPPRASSTVKTDVRGRVYSVAGPNGGDETVSS